MTEPHELTAAAAAALMRRRELSAVELMQSLLARARRFEPALRIWVTLDPDAALEAARSSQRALDRHAAAGPLHGIPVGIKDIYYTEGIRTTACSPIYADFVPSYDSTPVARLKQAGAIVMGKTVTTEFACGDPSPTRNPWDAAHTPGGSSSGSAVGVASRVFPAAMGSQTAGSVLRPASYNGVVGLKPTFGRISRYGVMAVSPSVDTMGTFTRDVTDAALMLDALAGGDPLDAASSTEPVSDYAAAVVNRASPPRIGVVRWLYDDKADQETREHTDAVVRRLVDRGARCEEVGLEINPDTLLSAHRVVITVEAANTHRADFSARPDDYAPNVRSWVESGMLTAAMSYVQAQQLRRVFRRQMEAAVERFDALLTPSTPAPAPRDLSTTGPPIFQTPWTTCGFPAISIPSGLSRSGLPFGIQLASAPFAEGALLSTARWCEQVLDVSLTPPDPE